MKTDYVLTIDIGTTNIKVILFNDRGEEEYILTTDVELIRPNKDYYEIDMDDLWVKVARTIKQVIHFSNVHPKHIRIIGLTGQGEGCWLVDDHLQPCRHAILWLDKRATDTVESLSDMTQHQLKAITHVQMMAGSTPILLKWLKDHEKETLNKAAYSLNCKDWIRLKLTGDIGTDYSDLSTSFLDANEGTISKHVFDLLDIGDYDHLVPEPNFSPNIAGKVTKSCQSLTGILAGTPVIYGMLDIVANTIGTGSIFKGDVCTTIGTTCSNQMLIHELPDNEYTGSIVYSVNENQYIRLMATMAGTPNIDWVVRELFHKEIESFSQMDDFYTYLDQKMEAVPTGSNGVIFHPYILGGERVPFNHPYATSQLFGINERTSKFHLAKAVYEGIACSINDCLANINDIDRIILGGGGSNSEHLAQIIASCTGVPVVTLKGKEHPSKGVFITAAVSSGLYKTYEEAVRQTIREEKVFHPNFEDYNIYKKLFKMYKQIRQNNVNLWELHHHLVNNISERS